MNPKLILQSLWKLLLEHPFETLISITITVLTCLDVSFTKISSMGAVMLFPIFFLISNMLNQMFTKIKWKWIYWLVSAGFIAILCSLPKELSDVHFLVGISIATIAYLSFKREENNELFAKNVLKVSVNAIFVCVIVSPFVYAVIMGIYSAVVYLFNVEHSNQFYPYAASIVFCCFMPMFYLWFSQKDFIESYKNKITDLIFNYLLTPALIIYALIFYAYLIRIVIMWELPKGNVALMVFGLGIAAFLLKMISPIFSFSFFNKLYKQLSFYLLPALILFWVGTVYRICEYGFTESRVYLLLGGIFLTTLTIMMFSKKTGRYFYAAILMIGLLFVFTFIPYISAKDIGERSQKNRIEIQ